MTLLTDARTAARAEIRAYADSVASYVSDPDEKAAVRSEVENLVRIAPSVWGPETKYYHQLLAFAGIDPVTHL